MPCRTGVLVSLSVCLLLQPPSPSQAAAPSDAAPGSAASRRRVLLTAPPAQYVPLRARIEPLTGDILIDDSDDLDIAKRFDDYGHMRFGKRGDPEDKFDDYGHMRFGRGHV